MEEILKKSNELGLLIKGTEIYQRFEELSSKLEADSDARNLIETYANANNNMIEKEKTGEVIDVAEKNELQELVEKVNENQLIKEYIATQSYYMNMLMQIQKAISEPEGEPIGESKIIKPSSNKIITDI